MKTVVIGYGNELRQDDGVGPRVARMVAGPGLEAIAVHQLTPELAERISQAEQVVFVDAGASEAVRAQRLAPAGATVWGHASDPQGLLALARDLYGWLGEAWLVQVPAASYAFGEELSDVGQQGLERAVELVRELSCDPVSERA
jgi:hydrogenase maturation protease